jgi:hypothetical protein
MWTQIVGKTLLARSPVQNHWWHAALRVSPRGLASLPAAEGDRAFDLELDLIDHLLSVRTSDGRSMAMPLVPRTVRSFHEEYMKLLAALGLDVHIWTTPVEVPDPVPFEQDEVHAQYDAAWAHRFWQVLRRCDAALRDLAAGYVGKQSPVHFFWGSFDLAVTRFSGRRAPERPGADRVTREAYSHEVSSCGFWTGTPPVGYPAFYAYAYPEPPGFADVRVDPDGAFYSADFREFVLPYARVRESPTPDETLLAFLQSTYEAAADLGQWDRAALERR